MTEKSGIEQNRRYVEIEEEIYRIVHTANGDTDDLINDLADWAFDRIETARS